MSAVIDANLIAALVVPLSYSDQATQKIMAWTRAGRELLAPVLLEYEITAILRRTVFAQWLTTDLAAEAIGKIPSLIANACHLRPIHTSGRFVGPTGLATPKPMTHTT